MGREDRGYLLAATISANGGTVIVTGHLADTFTGPGLTKRQWERLPVFRSLVNPTTPGRNLLPALGTIFDIFPFLDSLSLLDILPLLYRLPLPAPIIGFVACFETP